MSNEQHEFLVRARPPATLVPVAAYIASHPSITLVRQIGPPGEPHTLIAAMTEEAAEALRRHFANELIVELDRPLTPFSGGPIS